MRRVNEDEDNSSRNRMIFNGILAAAVLLLIFSVAGYVKERLIATAAERGYQDVARQVVAENHTTVDFATVHSHGSLARSWIYIPDTNIDYPLVQAANNDYYIDRDAYGNPSQAGAIFINFANSPDLTDVKTIIFGHNMSNGSMFTDLHKYSDETFGREHQNAYIYMEDGTVKHYRVLYYIYTEPLDPAVYVISAQDKGDEVAAELREKASLTFNGYMGGNMICLSTCSMHKYRTVVVFEYVDEALPIVGSAGLDEEAAAPAKEPVPDDADEE